MIKDTFMKVFWLSLELYVISYYLALLIIVVQFLSARDEGLTKAFDNLKFVNPVYNYTMPTTEECGKYMVSCMK